MSGRVSAAGTRWNRAGSRARPLAAYCHRSRTTRAIPGQCGRCRCRPIRLPEHCRPGADYACLLPEGSGAAGAGVEDLAVQVYVELDRAEPAGCPPGKPAERGKTPFPLTLLPRVADVVVSAVLGLTDPLAVRLRPGGVCGEVVPATRGPPGQPGAGDPVLAAAAQRAGEALVIPVALLDHRAVRVAAPPPGQQRRVLPQPRHPVAVDLVERVGEEVLRVPGREVETRGGRRIEAVDVVQFDRVETLRRAHPDPLVQHRLERVELPEVHPPFLRVAVVHVAERGGGEVLPRCPVRPVVLPGQV